MVIHVSPLVRWKEGVLTQRFLEGAEVAEGVFRGGLGARSS